MRFRTFAFAVVVTSACAHGWWKPGASATDLQADQEACRAEAGIAEPEARGDLTWGESPAFDRCMGDKGWHGARIASPPDSAQPKPEGAATALESAEGVAAVRAESGVAPTDPEPARVVEEVGDVEERPGPRLSGAGAWFKLGADGEALERDRTLCLREARELGEETDAAPGFPECMRGRGWFDLAR